MWSDLRFRLRALFQRQALERELDDELRFHLEQQIEKGVGAGLSREEAARRARLSFGTLDRTREECRDVRGTRLLDHARQDLAYAIRILRRSPVFASLAVASLAVGIGAATSVFVVLHTVVMQALPVPDADRLVVLQARRHGERFVLFNPVFEAIQRDQRVLTGMAAVSDDPFLPVAIDSSEPPAYMPASRVSGSYFEVLGVVASPGRTLTDADDVPGGPCSAVISHGLWVRRFGQRPSAVGAHLRVRDTVCTVVGVAPPEFRSHQGGYAPDLWLPLRAMTSRDMLQNHHMAFFSGVIGRLRNGVGRRDAERVLTERYRQVLAGEPEGELPPGVRPAQPSDYALALLSGAQGLGVIRNEFGSSLWIVFGVAVVFLLIATINVGTLLLARGTARTTELATRAALGAGRSRLIRQLATEGAVLALIGGTLGVALAWMTTPLLARAISMPYFTVVLEPGASLASSVAVAGLVAIVAILAGVLPAWRLSRVEVHPTVAASGRTTTRGGQRFARRLVVVQLALALLLVSVAGLLMQTLVHLRGVDPGFRPESVLVLEVQHESLRPEPADVPNAIRKQALAAKYDQLARQLNAIPGVRSAALCWLELFGGSDLGLATYRPDRPDVRKYAHTDLVSPMYFETVGMRMVAGRAFTDADRAGAVPVAVINEALARQWFGDVSPLGRTLTLEFESDQQPPFTVVGVVRDSKYNGLREDRTEPMVWMPLAQWPFEIRAVVLRVQAGAEPHVARDARARMAELDSSLMVRKETTLREQVDQTMAREHLMLNLASAAGLLAVLVAAIGVYGTLAYGVVQRTREFGIRMAVGADRGRVLRLVMRDAALVAVLGGTLGLPLAVAAGYACRAFLFGVTPTDATTLLGACAILVAVIAAASYLPARQASAVEPTVALRYE